jgi:hypothetical protein
MRERLVAVVVYDGAALQQVHTNIYMPAAHLQMLVGAAPQLQVLSAGLIDEGKELLPVLRNAPPYGVLRVKELRVCLEHHVPPADELALAAAVAAHESLNSLTLSGARSARLVNALIDAAADRRVSRLRITKCVLDAESFAALARLLRRSSLTTLEMSCSGFPRAQEPELYAALRACQTLTYLRLELKQPNGGNGFTLTELLDATAALPALSDLSLSKSTMQDKAASGQALGALLAANLPSLRFLRLLDCHLGDEGVAPLLDGLAANTHLRHLHCRNNNNLSDAFDDNRLAPALASLAARSDLNA